MNTLTLIIGAYIISALLIAGIIFLALKVPYTKKWRDPVIVVSVIITMVLLFSTLNGWQILSRQV